MALNKDVFQNKHTVSAYKRLKLSATGITYFLSTWVKIGKGDPVAYNLSYSYVDKTLRSVSEENSQNIKHSWVPSSKCIVHWDDKSTTFYDGGDNKKLNAVLVSGVKDIKLLWGSSIGKKLKSKYDSTASSIIKKELDTLKCTQNVFRMIFDTTGATSSACFLLQKI